MKAWKTLPYKVENILKGSLDSNSSLQNLLQWTFKSWVGKFAWGVKAKHCWALSTKILFSKAKPKLKHHFLTPLQDAAPHVQSKQHLKLFLIISESVDCLVCSDEDLRRNILTDFASIIWLTVSIHIYIWFFLKTKMRASWGIGVVNNFAEMCL